MMKFIPLIFLLIFFTSCESVSHNNIKLLSTSEEIPKTGQIYLEEGVSEKDLKEIMLERGGKDRYEIWNVSSDGKDILIKKSRTDTKVYLPGAAVESWYRDTKGKWTPRPTA